MKIGSDDRVPWEVWIVRLLFALVLGNEIRLLAKLWERATNLTMIICAVVMLASLIAIQRSFVRRASSLYFICAVMILLPLWFFLGFNTMAVRLTMVDWIAALPLQMAIPIWFGYHMITSARTRQFFGIYPRK